MDLNYLLRRQQEERSRAQSATCAAARAAHEAMASQFEEQIRRHTDGRVAFVGSSLVHH